VTERLRDSITTCEPTHALREKAIARGMRPLREAGLRAVFEGQTTIEEVVRYT
jgi:type IV pilus assembly protein PilB